MEKENKSQELFKLRNQVESVADQLCSAVKGEFNFSIEITTVDESIQKLSMLVNFVIDAARRALVDITEKNAKLVELDRVKSDFIANISHELRTPLTLILGPLETLLKDPSSLQGEQENSLKRIQRNALRLYILVNDLLDFTKLEAGKYALHEELIDLNELISQVVDDAQGLAKERKLTLHYSGSPKLDLMLFDRKLIEKVVINLVSNALKFTPEGGKVTVELKKQDDILQLSVTDTGIGIPDSKIPHLFERFYQVDSSSTRAYEGTGIGLTLVYDLLRLIQGRITVESQEGKGSKFIVSLPMRVARHGKSGVVQVNGKRQKDSQLKMIDTPLSLLANQPQKLQPPLPSSKKKKEDMPLIVVVDDNVDMREYIASILDNSCQIIMAENGKLALDVIAKHRPQVVLSDIMMPIMDGYQLTQLLKANPDLRNIQVILITAKASTEDLRSGIELGADDYLAKPFSAEELQARVQSALRLHQEYKKLEVANHKLSTEIEDRKKLEAANVLLNNQLVKAARIAGMADIATNMLHNIGNILNSVHVSISVIHEKINQSKVSKLPDIVNILNQHQHDIPSFIGQDSQGKLIPDYLSRLSQTWVTDREDILQEINSLNNNVNHIKDIIVNQNSIGDVLDIHQEVVVSEVIEEALLLNRFLYEKAHIEIVRQYGPIKKATLDRTKLLQVLVNLIKNGIESIAENQQALKQLTLTLQEINPENFRIQVADTGVGILPENLTVIFSHGFTTKKKGHGFGLHSSAVSIEEMGGKCSVESKGAGKGAVFSIVLPYQPPIKKEKTYNA